MKKVNFEYEIWLTTSNKWNPVCYLLVKTDLREKKYFWDKAVEKVLKSKWFYTKEDKKEIQDLKKMTDELYKNKI